MTRPTRLMGVLLAVLAFPVSAVAQHYRTPFNPTQCEASGACYVTAYYDLNRSSGRIRDWTCQTHSYDNHRGTDLGIGGFANMDRGRDVLAAADGVVVRAHDGEFDRCTSGACGAGNYVWIRHADAKVTLYKHLRKNSVAVATGQTVKCGAKLGQVGSSGYSTGPHLHFQVNLQQSDEYSSTDPFAASTPVCGAQVSLWVEQGNYQSLPSYRCEGEAAPAAPVSCDRTVGEFTFSCDGPQPGETCVALQEAGDPDGWDDNYLCSKQALGLRWSMAGPIPEMDCVKVNEPAEPQASLWEDNYLCAPQQSAYSFRYSSAGPLPTGQCLHLNEPADLGNSWQDNYVCITRNSEFSAGGFTFKSNGPKPGATCINVNEPGDPDSWADNYFCSTDDVGMVWSNQGRIDGMDCTNVTEPAETRAAVWADNFLCVPRTQRYRFTWSSAGPLSGQTCVRWLESLESTGTWRDNWMCVREVTPDALSPAPSPEPSSPTAQNPEVRAEEDAPTLSLTGSDSSPGRARGGCGAAQGAPVWLLAVGNLMFLRRRRKVSRGG